MGWKMRLPKFGAISTAKIADPMAMGSAMAVESRVTANDVTMSGSAPIMGWKMRLPKFGAISTAKIADPMAMGSAMAVESRVTANDVTMSGSAPVCGRPVASSTWARLQLVPVKNPITSTPSLKKVERPFCATMKISATTRSVTSATHAPVTPWPTLSRLRLGMCFAMTHLSRIC